MMARSHALSGALVGLSVYAVAVPGPLDLPVSGLTATLCAGYALLPDLDHPESTATRTGGVLTGALSAWLRAVSMLTFRATASRADRVRARHDAGGHRYLLHTPAFALVLGALVALAVQLGGPGVNLVVYASGIALADRALRLRLRLPRFPGRALLVHWPASLGLIGLLAASHGALEGDTAGWPHGAVLGALVASGCLIHDAGDAVTNTGVPMLWPLPVRGRRWARFRAPAWMVFSTGGRVEWWVRAAMTCGLLAVAAGLTTSA